MTRSAAVVGAATLASRITGLFRDVVLAWVLGASMPADAFFAAFRIPNFLRRIFAEGSLSAAFIPVFTEVQAREGRPSAFRLASVILNWLVPILLIVCAAGVAFAPQLVHVMTPGWVQHPEKFSLTVELTRITFPYILLISVAALAMGVLNAQGHFFSPAFAPVLLNLAMISAALLASQSAREVTAVIAVGVLLGGGAQILLQAPALWRKGYRYQWGLAPRDPNVRRVGRLFVPSLIGSTVYQVNMIVIQILASLLPDGSLSYLFYADRLMEFPLGVFAIAVGTVALPALSRHAATEDMAMFRETLAFAFRQVSLIMIPAAVGLIVLREPLISVIFQRGRFDPVATQMSAQALLWYSVGLWFVAEIRVLAPAFYALKDTTTPMKAAVVAICANILFSLLLMAPLAHGGLALAISLSAMVQMGILLWKLRPLLKEGGWNRLLGPMGKTILASGVMGLLCWLVASGVDWTGATPFLTRTLLLGASIAVGIAIYLSLLYVLRVKDLKDLVQAFRGRSGRGGS
jgi:putative peptidoglycan lipid II flippase